MGIFSFNPKSPGKIESHLGTMTWPYGSAVKYPGGYYIGDPDIPSNYPYTLEDYAYIIHKSLKSSERLIKYTPEARFINLTNIHSDGSQLVCVQTPQIIQRSDKSLIGGSMRYFPTKEIFGENIKKLTGDQTRKLAAIAIFETFNLIPDKYLQQANEFWAKEEEKIAESNAFWRRIIDKYS